MWQLNPEPLTLVNVRDERLAVTILRWTFAHILETRFVVHRGVHLFVAGVKDLRSQSIAQSRTNDLEKSIIFINC